MYSGQYLLCYTLNVVEVADYIDRVGLASGELVLEREVAVVTWSKETVQFLIIQLPFLLTAPLQGFL